MYAKLIIESEMKTLFHTFYGMPTKVLFVPENQLLGC
jgi:hypothetical protein